MAERNCYNGSTCEELVTIGYMKEMVTNAGASGCVAVGTPDGYSSCCSADGNGYIPTYGQIEDGLFANKRVIASDPSNDVNGFSAKTPTLDTLGCCGNGVTINDKKVKKDDFTLGVTRIEDVGISDFSTNECSLSGGGNVTATYKIFGTYTRYDYSCDKSSYTSITTSSSTSEVISTKEYGQITQTASTVGDVTTVSGISNVTYNPSSGIITASKSGCGGSPSDSHSWNLQNYNAYVEFSFPAEFACDGSSYINVTTHSECGNDVSIDTSSAKINGMTIPYENSRFEISNPSVDDGNTFEVNITIGGTQQLISFQITKQNCKQTVKIKSAMDCGLYPGEDDWSNTNAEIHPFR